MEGVQVQLVIGELRTELGMQIQVKQGRLSVTTAMENRVALDEEQLLFIAGGQDNAVDEDVDKQLVQDLALNVDNVFQADDYPIYDEASPLYDSDILYEVHDYDHYQDAVCEHHEAHEMHHDVQPNCVVDSNVDYTSDSNMITYDQYVKDNAEPVPPQSVSANNQNKVVNALLTAKLATYKEQVELHERRAKFELTKREQKIEEQLRIVITDHNIKQENLKKELHSVKMQLTSTINHNKSMVEEVMSLKKDFKQKENKYLEEFLDMKDLKEKVKDKLYKQDQSLQTVHLLCKPKPYYDEQNKDVLKMKAESLKEQTPASRPIKALTVYPPNTPLQRLSPGITPTGLTEWERGFEQTKECYLTEVIPFFKTLKEHFEGIQKALTKEIKEMKEIFDELEAEVDQDVVNRKYDEIERKNLLIANDNLIADCLSKEVFYVATNFELTVSRFTEMHDAHTVVQARCLELEAKLSKLHDKITRAKHIEQTTALLTDNENLKAQIHEHLKCNTMDSVKPKVLALGRYVMDVEPKPLRNRNNREVHLDYLKHLKESVETLRELVEEAKVDRPLDRSLTSACLYTKHSQELLEYVIGTCPKDFNKRDKKHATTPLTKKKQVTFKDQCETSNNNTHKHVKQLNIRKTNIHVIPSIGVNSCTDASGSQPRSNTKKNRISPAERVNKKKVEEHPRTNKSSLKTTNHVDSSISYKCTVINSNSHSVCKTFKQVWKPKQVKQVWKATSNVLTSVGYQWRPTRRIFTLGEQCPLTRLTKSNVVPAKQTENVSTSKTMITGKLSHTSQKQLTRYQRKNQQYQPVLVSLPTSPENQAIAASMQYAIAYANQQEPNQNWGFNFPNSPSLSVFKCMSYRSSFVRFENDHFSAIMGNEDYVIGDSVISRVYYVEGLGHNLFSVRQFCDTDMEVAFRKHLCYV
ncbi:hypothetical protein Tco_1531945 [Tanacetum coccineum]